MHFRNWDHFIECGECDSKRCLLNNSQPLDSALISRFFKDDLHER